MPKASPHRLNGPIIKLRRGLALYRTHASPYYFARILDNRTGRYKVRSTKEKSRLQARTIAEELAQELYSRVADTPREFSFKHHAQKFLDHSQTLVEGGLRNGEYIKNAEYFLTNKKWGLLRWFGPVDVRTLTTRDWQQFIEDVQRRRPGLSPSTLNMLMVTFRNVLKAARDDGVIDFVPATPRVRQKDNPRAFFRFSPLVSKSDDEYQKLLKGALKLEKEQAVIRGIQITHELYDLILFCVHSFVRPTTSELYALKFGDIAVEKDPKRLLVTIRKGKTGFRIANTLPGAVAVVDRARKRYPDVGDEDYLFLPGYPNRKTAARIFQRQFNHLLDVTGLKHDPITDTDRTVYSLRHTAICMRIVLSHGKVNIFNLAKNAGTSVEQIERFYARNLPLSREIAMNLQSFGE